jgi:hypothetical protein
VRRVRGRAALTHASRAAGGAAGARCGAPHNACMPARVVHAALRAGGAAARTRRILNINE